MVDIGTTMILLVPVQRGWYCCLLLLWAVLLLYHRSARRVEYISSVCSTKEFRFLPATWPRSPATLRVQPIKLGLWEDEFFVCIPSGTDSATQHTQGLATHRAQAAPAASKHQTLRKKICLFATSLTCPPWTKAMATATQKCIIPSSRTGKAGPHHPNPRQQQIIIIHLLLMRMKQALSAETVTVGASTMVVARTTPSRSTTTTSPRFWIGRSR